MRTETTLRYRPDGRTLILPPVPRLYPPERPGAFPSLSVVLALHGQRLLTERCLGSLRADVPEAEVLCVDNASPDDTRAWLAGQPVRSVLLDENRGCAGGWNAGLAQARGAVLCVLNNDTLIHPGGMRALAQAAWERGIAAQSGGVLSERFEFVRRTDDAAEADYPEGYALAFRRDVWEALGPFDEGFRLGYCEDADWGLRARAAGRRFALVPGCVEHLGGRTAQTVPGLDAAVRRNGARLRRRWAGKGVGERLLIRRWGALGDLVMATPALRALRAAKPLSHLWLWCAPQFADLWQDLAALDGASAEPVPDCRLLDLDGAYERYHTRGEWRPPALCYAEALGVALASCRYEVPVVPDLAAWAEAKLLGAGYVACGLRSAFRPKVNWSEAGWVALVRACPERTFVLLDAEARPSLEVRGTYAGPPLWEEPNVLDLTGETPTPRHLVALLARCAACVTVDSAPLHLASALSLPTVALVASAPGWALAPPEGRLLVLQGEAPCYPCSERTRCPREDGGHCLGWVTGERVAGALVKVLGEG